MTTLIEKMNTTHDALVEKMGQALEDDSCYVALTRQGYEKSISAILAVVIAHYSDPENVSDEMCEAAITSWNGGEADDVLSDWQRLIAAAMKAVLTES